VSLTVDRIGRGTTLVKHCTLSLVGGIQPSKLEGLVRTAMSGVNDDGLLQRLQLAVWPDKIKDWKYVDLAPNKEASEAYHSTFRALLDYEPKVKIHRFTDDAQELFIDWMRIIQTEARSDETPSAMESFLVKLPKTICSIALLCELVKQADILSTTNKPVLITIESFDQALMWADYLIRHAKRIYSCALDGTAASAALILSRREKLSKPFRLRAIQQKNWTGLSERDDIQNALDMLYEHNYLRAQKVESNQSGGRPTLDYFWTIV
jgi:hypothetical protein